VPEKDADKLLELSTFWVGLFRF